MLMFMLPISAACAFLSAKDISAPRRKDFKGVSSPSWMLPSMPERPQKGFRVWDLVSLPLDRTYPVPLSNLSPISLLVRLAHKSLLFNLQGKRTWTTMCENLISRRLQSSINLPHQYFQFPEPPPFFPPCKIAWSNPGSAQLIEY